MTLGNPYPAGTTLRDIERVWEEPDEADEAPYEPDPDEERDDDE